MKAISLWQPWASAVAVGSKGVETRSWATSHRGPLAIHAAKHWDPNELMHLHSIWGWQGAMRAAGWSWGSDREGNWKRLPFGALIAVVELVDCRPTDAFTQAELDAPRRPADEASDSYDWTERLLGDYGLGRFGWIFANVRALPKPIPLKGGQRIFNVPEGLCL